MKNKNNLKVKELEKTKKKAKILTNENLLKGSQNVESKISLADTWKREIEDLKTNEFCSLDEVKAYIVNVVAKKEELANDKDFLELANTILEGNPQIDEILAKYVKK
ncbi:MAG: hypothetical protein ACOX3T_08025 [Bdellovibrionota bacterium]